MLPYSSGTTGRGKGVILTHRNLVANLCQVEPVFQLESDVRILAVLPFFHIYGMTVMMNQGLHRRATVITMPKFDLKEFLRVISTHQARHRLHRAADRGGAGQAPDRRGIRPVLRRRALSGRPRWTPSSGTRWGNVSAARCGRATG